MFDLNRTLDLSNLSAHDHAMLGDLQANILKGHGREFVRLLFITIKPGAKAKQDAKNFVKAIGNLVMSAQEQLESAAFFKATKAIKPPPLTDAVLAFFLTHKGYQALGHEASSPNHLPYRQGLKARRNEIADPPAMKWEKKFQGDIHAMILIGGSLDKPKNSWTSKQAADKEKLVRTLMSSCATVVHTETGRAIKNDVKNGNQGLEHFGYVDGRSQPLFIKGDIDFELSREPNQFGGKDWDQAFKLNRLMFRDPGGTGDHSMGSFFVMRKLSQDVKRFKVAEEELQKELNNKTKHPFPGVLKTEVAGAMIVGRFENGTPITLNDVEKNMQPPGSFVNNNFSYTNDAQGTKCPFHAHIRKANPRGTSAPERSHIMARRGITYGKRKLNPDGSLADALPLKNDVGLLFMAYNVDIAEQFEFTQNSWANNSNFQQAGVGPDPIIGQGNLDPQHNRLRWNDPTCPVVDSHFADCVQMKGGEYFFAPSRSFLQNIS